MLEELIMFQDVGVAVGALVMVFAFNKWIAEKSFTQIERAQKQLIDNNEKMFTFMDSTFKENTKAISEMISTLKDHMRMKDEALDMLKRR
uniref:Holin n=1 Tax=viral metagenome TaxID=1070528 RepID=A0A6M3X4V3_9ZZZZ